ncbi:MAG: phosphoribosyltransferase [Burkholderiales bacterium PBB4]|nr:MAG: phosphoribosyltransferase [Burkholderiales bacterium PBB4]
MFRHLLPGLSRRVSLSIPSQCAVCHHWPSQPVCEACMAQFAQPTRRCRTCALPIEGDSSQCSACLHSPPVFGRCIAAVRYAYPWSELIVAFKFQGHPAWAQSFAHILRSTPWVEPLIEDADLLLPLPLSKSRLQWRGYNQSQLIADAIAPQKCASHLLLRIKDTPPQSSLSREERLRSVRDAFAVDPLRMEQVRGKKVVLVDDVMTSGASMASAARSLQLAGAAQVNAIVFARTDKDPNG